MPSESDDKYFAVIKFCTQLLISLCKTHHAFPLNARPSMLFPSLHNFRAGRKSFRVGYATQHKILVSVQDEINFRAVPQWNMARSNTTWAGAQGES
jgi:hypothetical protein